MSTDLATRLRDRLAEVERDQDSCFGWHTRYCGNQPVSQMFGDCECDVPASVLRQVAASRKLLELHALETGVPYPSDCVTCGDWEDKWEGRCRMDWPCPTLQALAEMWGVSA